MGGASVLLVKFPWRHGRAAEALRSQVADRAALRIFRALDAGEGYAYVVRPAQADGRPLEDAIRRTAHHAEASCLELLLDMAGASADEEALYRYVVETDVRPEHEADFNAWYDCEHMPGLAAVAGTARAMRFRRCDGHPRYHACYDLARREALGSPAWLAVRATPWSNRVRPAFFNTHRTMFERWW